MNIAIKEMLLIEEPTVQILKDELMKVSGWFVLPSFVLALCLEYFGELKFTDVIKKLFLILAFIGVFYSIHKTGVELSFKASEEILRKVSPRNIFLRSWTEVKVKTKEDASWNWLQKFSIPNINDFIGTAMFILSKAFIWILKLIYSTVYHLTYVFAPLTAVLYFFPITRGAMSGTIQSTLWCMLMPIVLVSILAIVGNSIQVPARDGALAIISIDHILWLFGVTLLLLMSPILTLGLLRGGGVAMSGSAIGVMMTGAGMKLITSIPHASNLIKNGVNKFKKTPVNISEMVKSKQNPSKNLSSSKILNSPKGFNKSEGKRFQSNELVGSGKSFLNTTNKASSELSNVPNLSKPIAKNVMPESSSSLKSEKLETNPKKPENQISIKKVEGQHQISNKKYENSQSRNHQASSKEGIQLENKAAKQKQHFPAQETKPYKKLFVNPISSKRIGGKNEIRNI